MREALRVRNRIRLTEVLPHQLTVELRLNRNHSTVVDVGDFPLVAPHRWTFQSNRATGSECVITRMCRSNGSRTTVAMHRLILGEAALGKTRHLNGDNMDNRRGNLGIHPSPSSHHQPKKPPRCPRLLFTPGPKVCWCSGLQLAQGSRAELLRIEGIESKKPWVVHLEIDSQVYCLGHFGTEEDAINYLDEVRHESA